MVGNISNDKQCLCRRDGLTSLTQCIPMVLGKSSTPHTCNLNAHFSTVGNYRKSVRNLERIHRPQVWGLEPSQTFHFSGCNVSYYYQSFVQQYRGHSWNLNRGHLWFDLIGLVTLMYYAMYYLLAIVFFDFEDSKIFLFQYSRLRRWKDLISIG